jgi:hypothetical protein
MVRKISHIYLLMKQQYETTMLDNLVSFPDLFSSLVVAVLTYFDLRYAAILYIYFSMKQKMLDNLIEFGSLCGRRINGF